MIRLIISFLFLCFPITGHTQLGKCLVGNCKEGYGHFLWLSGEEYLGNFHEGLRDGYGVFYWNDKKKFVGTWKVGKMHGKGLLFHSNGYIQRGVWHNNTFIKLLRPPYQLSEQLLAHGKTQLQQLLKDRPAMQQWAQLDDAIGEWVILQLAGAAIKAPIYWQNSANPNFPIPNGANAVHAYPTPKTEARIWVCPNASPEEQWAGFIYELHNIQNGEAFQAIEKDAQRFRCTQEEYVMRYARLEYKAAQATAQFYKNIWQPFCASQGLTSTPQYWFYYLPPTFEEWAAGFTNKKGYPWYPYEEYYQKILQARLKNY